MKAGELLFIVGPTASGKTELALREAVNRGAVILSCDSLCVYRGMDIGTAKPTREEQLRIPHFGIDLVGPEERFSVIRYMEYRDSVLAECREAGRPVVVVGGSGFYLKSFFAPVVDRISVPDTVLGRVQSIRDEGGLAALEAALREIHPEGESFPGLDLQNPRRVEKALLRCLASGRSYRELREAFASQPLPLPEWKKEVWMISRPEDELRERNRCRVVRMLKEGLIEEVRQLRERGFESNPSASGAIGYREVLAHLDAPGTVEELETRIYVHTNQLMRKQRTWFGRHIRPDCLITGDS